MDIDKRKIKWVKTWQTAAESLKSIKRAELQVDDYYEKNRELLEEMLQYACEKSNTRLYSGLVEQQRLFRKMYKRNMKD